MKVLQGVTRQYQLVDRTKTKDIDGIRYLVAGESNLWVKILKDKSVAKKIEIEHLISAGGFSGFEKPLETVSDHRGFVGYTFIGPEMDVVPVTPVPAPSENERKHKEKKIQKREAEQERLFEGRPTSKEPVSNELKNILLVVWGLLLVGATISYLHRSFIRIINDQFSQVAAQGCAVLSINGIIPAIVGVMVLIACRKICTRVQSLFLLTVSAILLFFVGLILGYTVIGVLSVLVTSIFGVAKAYESVIILVITLIVLAKIIFVK